MNKELMEALDILEKEKNISKDTLTGSYRAVPDPGLQEPFR